MCFQEKQMQLLKIKEVKFIKSAQTISQCPSPKYPEVVFLGRSNVGKSTVINHLTQKKIAKSSSTPGKTQLINYFEIVWGDQDQNFSSYFVDLPGFGYAKVSKDLKQLWEKHLWEFLQYRSSIKVFIHLIDSRHQNLEIDQIVGNTLKELCNGDQSILKIYTKCDKLNHSQRAKLAQKNTLLVSNQEEIFKPNQGGRAKVLEAIFSRLFLCK